MNKYLFLAVLILYLFPLFSDNTDYLDNIRLEPEHGALNFDGEVKIVFDLPKDNLVEKVYLSYFSGIEEKIFTSTEVTGSNLGYLNNALTLKGSELYKVLESLKTIPYKNKISAASEIDEEDYVSESTDQDYLESEPDNETSDNDTETGNDYSWADKKYEISLTVGLNNEDNETDDSDSTSSATVIPEKVTEKVKITFDNVPPGKPENVETEGGDGRIIIRVSPPQIKGKPEEIGKYHTKLKGLFRNNNGQEINSVLEYISKVSTEKYDKIWEFSISGKDGLDLINNDENKDKYIYEILIRAEDIAGNSDSEATLKTTASAVTTFGFWSNYKEKGGNDDGGFCFIATAGYGSYLHPHVKILRNFRDLILLKFSLGKSFVDTYYKFGKIPAKTIKNNFLLKAITRIFLLPLVITAWLLTSVTGRMILFLWFIVFSMLFIKRKSFSVFAVISGVLIFNTQDLKAVDGEFSFNNSFFYPSKIDKQPEGKPFKEVGGEELRYMPSITFGLKVPVLENYIRWSFVGEIGFTRLRGTSIKADGSKSEDKTAMYFIPLSGETKIRPGYSFPIWPYASFGIDYYIWWIREKDSTAQDGGTFGFHGSFGLMLSLNWLDESASRKFEESVGITNTSLFAHYRLEKINDFGKKESFDLSSNRFEFGIIFEF